MHAPGLTSEECRCWRRHAMAAMAHSRNPRASVLERVQIAIGCPKKCAPTPLWPQAVFVPCRWHCCEEERGLAWHPGEPGEGNPGQTKGGTPTQQNFHRNQACASRRGQRRSSSLSRHFRLLAGPATQLDFPVSWLPQAWQGARGQVCGPKANLGPIWQWKNLQLRIGRS